MKRIKIVFIVVFCFILSGCGKNNVTMEKLNEIVMTCDLQDDPEIIAYYKKMHSSSFIWPEVQKAAEVSGYTSISIYLFGSRLVMVLRYPEKADLDEINKRYNNVDERMKEWAALMESLQLPPKGAEKDVTWVPMERIYHFQ